MRRAAAALAAVALGLAFVDGPAIAGTSTPRVSFSQVQQEFMCTICHEPLNVARSPEAYNENAYLRLLIGRGDTATQIKREMVDQYGSSVLAQPPATGFNVLIYIVPPAVVLAGLSFLALTLPRWRRRSRDADARRRPAGPALSPEDAQRLESELSSRRL